MSSHPLDTMSFRLAAGFATLAAAASIPVANAQFGAEQLIDSGIGQVRGLHAADLDGDADIDIISVRFQSVSKLDWYENLGGGVFGPARHFPEQPNEAGTVVTMDADGDGDLDVLASVATSQPPLGMFRVNLYTNLGGGNFATPVTIVPPGPWIGVVGVADVEGDGDLDFFYGSGFTVRVLLTQAGVLSTTPIDVVVTPQVLYSLSLADMDLDGDVDVIGSALPVWQTFWFENVGLTSPFNGPRKIDGAPSISLSTADLDGDGLPDVVAVGTTSNTPPVRWYKNPGSSVYGAFQTIPSPGFAQGGLCADLDGDGDSDVISRELYGASWYANNGLGSFGAEQVITTGPHTVRAVIAADFDGDGLDDIVVGSIRGGDGGRIAWFRNGNHRFVPFCFGDGSGAACPCGNVGSAGNGCGNSVDAGGANLSGTGSPSVSNDSFVLVGSHMPNGAALYFQGTAQLAGGNGLTFGDGLGCVGGAIVRLGTKANSAGSSTYPSAGDASISIGGGNAVGDVRQYQCWYRNAAVFCTPSVYNLTNGLETTWVP